MTISKLQILLDLNKENEQDVLAENACLTDYGYFFVDLEDGQCYLFDEYGQLDDIRKMMTLVSAKKDIKKIVIPESVESIGYLAFDYCLSLQSIKIPENVERIGFEAFCNCTSLKSIEIQKRVKNIGHWAFWNCTSLEEVIFKGKTMDQVKSMDYYPWGIEGKDIIRCEKS